MDKTIKKEVTAEITEKKSKFIANIFHISSVEEAEEILKKVRKKYNDARHNCYAYRVLKDGEIVFKSSDDGEPSGTAGAPMLNILEKEGIINILVVVTRYFGGILLGTGGLVKAYSGALQEALSNTEYVEEQEGYEIEIQIKYKDLNNLKYYCEKSSIEIIDIKYNDDIKCIIEVNEEEKQKILSDDQTNNLKITDYKIIRKKYIQKNIEK